MPTVNRHTRPPARPCSRLVTSEIMPAPTERHPLTGEQRKQLDQDLVYIQERLQEIIVLMRVCYGEASQPAVRAEEAVGALQRLKWELERAPEVKQAGG